jgi:serine/threonine-protein kinase
VARNEQIVHLAIPAEGEHEVRIEHPCCAPFVRRIGAAEATAVGELRVPLQPRPARLRVDGDPGTLVFVDGRDSGTAGESQRSPIVVPIPAGGASPYEGTARIRLELAGAASEVQVRIRAGESFTVGAPQPEAPYPVAEPEPGGPEAAVPGGGSAGAGTASGAPGGPDAEGAR